MGSPLRHFISQPGGACSGQVQHSLVPTLSKDAEPPTSFIDSIPLATFFPPFCGFPPPLFPPHIHSYDRRYQPPVRGHPTCSSFGVRVVIGPAIFFPFSLRSPHFVPLILKIITTWFLSGTSFLGSPCPSFSYLSIYTPPPVILFVFICASVVLLLLPVSPAPVTIPIP